MRSTRDETRGPIAEHLTEDDPPMHARLHDQSRRREGRRHVGATGNRHTLSDDAGDLVAAVDAVLQRQHGRPLPTIGVIIGRACDCSVGLDGDDDDVDDADARGVVRPRRRAP